MRLLKKPRQEGADPYDFHTCLLLLLCPAEGYFDMIDVVELKSIFFLDICHCDSSHLLYLSVYIIFLQLGVTSKKIKDWLKWSFL